MIDEARADVIEIMRAVRILADPDALMGLHLLGGDGQDHLLGYFGDLEALVRHAAHWSGRVPAVFVTLNPVDSGRASAPRDPAGTALLPSTQDDEILRRRWFPIDLDPVRTSGASSSDGERRAVLATAARVRAWLSSLGWPAPVLADSGNGVHLLYRIELPNAPESTRLVALGLAALDLRWSDAAVTVDASVADAARRWKLYGTLAANRAATRERPHRLARLLEVPPQLAVVPAERLAALLRTPRPPPA